MKDMIKHCMTSYPDEIQVLVQSPLGGPRFKALVNRWEMNNEPPPTTIGPKLYVLPFSMHCPSHIWPLGPLSITGHGRITPVHWMQKRRTTSMGTTTRTNHRRPSASTPAVEPVHHHPCLVPWLLDENDEVQSRIWRPRAINRRRNRKHPLAGWLIMTRMTRMIGQTRSTFLLHPPGPSYSQRPMDLPKSLEPISSLRVDHHP